MGLRLSNELKPLSHFKDLRDWARIANDLYFTKSQQKTYIFYRNKVIYPGLFLGATGIAAAYMCWAYFQCLPGYHNKAIKDSYEDRKRRHLTYIKDKPEYVPALLQGYESLRPPQY